MVSIDGKQDGCITVDTCCIDDIERFVQLSKLEVVMELLARSSGTNANEDKARCMFRLIVGLDYCLMALKMLLFVADVAAILSQEVGAWHGMHGAAEDLEGAQSYNAL